jgi:hypothetical protein
VLGGGARTMNCIYWTGLIKTLWHLYNVRVFCKFRSMYFAYSVIYYLQNFRFQDYWSSRSRLSLLLSLPSWGLYIWGYRKRDWCSICRENVRRSRNNQHIVWCFVTQLSQVNRLKETITSPNMFIYRPPHTHAHTSKEK